MSRYAISISHQDSSRSVVSFDDKATNEEIIAHFVTRGGNYMIKELIICSEDMRISNVSPIATWIKTIKRIK